MDSIDADDGTSNLFVDMQLVPLKNILQNQRERAQQVQQQHNSMLLHRRRRGHLHSVALEASQVEMPATTTSTLLVPRLGRQRLVQLDEFLATPPCFAKRRRRRDFADEPSCCHASINESAVVEIDVSSSSSSLSIPSRSCQQQRQSGQQLLLPLNATSGSADIDLSHRGRLSFPSLVPARPAATATATAATQSRRSTMSFCSTTKTTTTELVHDQHDAERLLSSTARQVADAKRQTADAAVALRQALMHDEAVNDTLFLVVCLEMASRSSSSSAGGKHL